VLRLGVSELYPEVSDAMIERYARDKRHLSVLRQLGMRSVMLVPLRGRSLTYGVLTLASSESGRRFSGEDLRVAESIAFQAGMAVENALLFERAEEAIRTRDEFLSIASHELKTPLTTLKLKSQVVKRRMGKGPLPQREDWEEFVASVIRQTDRLTDLVEDMLDTSRINMGSFSLKGKEVSLVDLAESVVTRMGAQLRRFGCSVVLQADKAVKGRWDREKIGQALQHLLSNACKYGPGKPIGLFVEKDGPWAVVRVKDDGIGIAEEDQKRIFQRYERAVSANEVSGMGLGLFFVKQVVDLHGGGISLNSRIGRGSEFVLRLPLKEGIG
jgi:signal transduction histidine kinase